MVDISCKEELVVKHSQQTCDCYLSPERNKLVVPGVNRRRITAEAAIGCTSVCQRVMKKAEPVFDSSVRSSVANNAKNVDKMEKFR